MSSLRVSSCERTVIRQSPSATPFGAAVAGMLIWCAATNALAQTPHDTSPVIQISQTEATCSDNDEAVNAATESRPKGIDISLPAQQKAVARRLVEEAKQSVIQGDMAKARNLARRAADIPTTWDLTELTPERLLRELDFIAANQQGTDHESAEADLTDSEARQPLRKLARDNAAFPGGWTSTDGVRRIPTEALDISQDSEEDDSRLPTFDDQTAPIPANGYGYADANQLAVSADGDAPLVHTPGPFAGPAVIDVRVHDFNSSSDTGATQPASITTLILINLASALFGGLVVLVGVLYYILKKFGPRPEFVLKVEVASNGGETRMTNVASPPPHGLRVAPISARREQPEDAAMHEQFLSTQNTAA